MKRKCPSCKSANVRRSSTPEAERTWRNEVLSRYRCRDCMLQFWVISRRTYLAAAATAVAIALIVVAVFLLDMVANPEMSTPTKRPRRSDGGHHTPVMVAAAPRPDSTERQAG